MNTQPHKDTPVTRFDAQVRELQEAAIGLGRESERNIINGWLRMRAISCMDATEAEMLRKLANQIQARDHHNF